MQNQPKIDEIDAKILNKLLKESRTSFTEIAKECQITIGAVRMRYKRLKKEGIITGEVMLVNPHSLGYRHIVDLGITSTVEREKEVAEFLESKPYIAQMVVGGGPFGKYNFFGKAALRDLNKLSSIIEDLESNPHITRVDAQIWAEAVNVEYPQNLIIKPLNGEDQEKPVRPAPINIEEAQATKFDEIDRKIAIALSQKSRTPFRKIAQELGISTKNVIQRYKRLRENVLTISTITVDLKKLGFNALAHLSIKAANRSKMPDAYAQLLKIPNLIVMIRQIGTYDLYACIALEDFEAWFKAAFLLHKIDGIQSIETLMGPTPPYWPLNLFPSLLQGDTFQPKYWLGARKRNKR